MNWRIATALGLQERGQGQESDSRKRGLDVGCGAGSAAIWLSKTYHCEVLGIALEPDERERAERAAAERGASDATRFEIRDYTRTGLQQHSFDFIYAIESVCHCPDKREFLIEMRRLLRPGGHLVVADCFRLARPYAPDDEGLMSAWLRGWEIVDLVTRREFLAAAREACFAEFEMTDITRHVLPCMRRLYLTNAILAPAQKVLRLTGIWPARQVEDSGAVRLRHRAHERGLWFHGLFTARA